MESSPSFFTLIRSSVRTRVLATFFIVVWAIIGIVLLTIEPLYFFIWCLALICVIFFASFAITALYAMAIFHPFLELQMVYGSFNVPFVDMIGLFAFIGWTIRTVFTLVDAPSAWKHIRWWGAPLFCAWIIVACISAFRVPVDQLLSLKYVLRPLGFFYLIFVFFPLNIIQSKKTLHYLLYILFGVSIVIALYGLYGFGLSFINPNIPRRVSPVSLFGFTPLGGSHNMISDSMIVTIPIGLYLLSKVRKIQHQKWIFLGLLLMISTTLFTFSRTGWLALLIELFIFIIFEFRCHIQKMIRYTLATFFIILPVVLYMFYFSFGTEIVSSSNYNRSLLNDVAWEMFRDAPFFGTGPGTFMTHVSLNHIYIVEFGAPLDAHGFIQKVGGELGLFGLIIYIGLLAYVVYTIYHAYRLVRMKEGEETDAFLLLSLLLLACGSIFTQLFQTSYFVGKIWFPLGIAVAGALLMQKKYSLKRNG